jgi:hypothetical protein
LLAVLDGASEMAQVHVLRLLARGAGFPDRASACCDAGTLVDALAREGTSPKLAAFARKLAERMAPARNPVNVDRELGPLDMPRGGAAMPMREAVEPIPEAPRPAEKDGSARARGGVASGSGAVP